MTKTEFNVYCLGNILKYRLRAGKKGDAQECLQKANKYNELYEQYNSLCHRDV
jgi:two-component SAPR family response regulator